MKLHKKPQIKTESAPGFGRRPAQPGISQQYLTQWRNMLAVVQGKKPLTQAELDSRFFYRGDTLLYQAPDGTYSTDGLKIDQDGYVRWGSHV